MLRGSYTQITIKFPASKERYRQAVECLNERDRSVFKTQADYLTAAILSFEGKLADDHTALSQIYQKVTVIEEKVDRLCDEK